MTRETPYPTTQAARAPDSRLTFVMFALLLLVLVPIFTGVLTQVDQKGVLSATRAAQRQLKATVTPGASSSGGGTLRAALAFLETTQGQVESRTVRLHKIQIALTLSLGILGLLACWVTRGALGVMRANLSDMQYLAEANENRVRALESLFDTASHLSLSAEPAQTYSYLTDRIAGVLEATRVDLWRYDPESDALIALASGPLSARAPRRLLLAECDWAREVIASRRPMRWTDAGSEPCAALSVRTLLAAPLTAHGQAVGLLTAADKAGSSGFTDDDARLLSTFAGQAAFLLHGVASYASALERGEEIAALAAITAAVNQSMDLAEIVGRLAQEAARIFPFAVLDVVLLPPAPDQRAWYPAESAFELNPTEWTCSPSSTTSNPDGVQDGRQVWDRWSASPSGLKSGPQREPVNRNCVLASAMVPAELWPCKEDHLEPARASLAAPLHLEGADVGAIGLRAAPGHLFTERHAELLKQVAAQLAGAVQRVRLFQDANYRADQLEWAMQETHHRIKNNLQMVSAILDIYLMDSDAQELVSAEGMRHALREIRTIAAVHDLLNEDVRIGRVNGKELLEALMPLLVTSGGPQSVQVDARIEADPIMLPGRIANAFALTANELVTNAIRHGGQGRSHMQLTMSLHCSPDELVLSVADDGPGFNTGEGVSDAAMDGLTLVRTLIERDHGGAVRIKTEGGAVVEAAIPIGSGASGKFTGPYVPDPIVTGS